MEERIQKLTKISIRLSVSILIQTLLQQQQRKIGTFRNYVQCSYIERHFRLFELILVYTFKVLRCGVY